ncbi:nucleotidyltransferase family protein [Brucella pseudogrignonensis]
MTATEIDPASAVAVMVLGAGRSERFKGGDKLEQILMGKPVAHHVLSVLAGFNWSRKVVVCRAQPGWTQAYVDAGFIRAEIATPDTDNVKTDEADRGMTASIHRGLLEMTTQQWVMICLADMPLITRCHIGELLAAFEQNRTVAVATRAASGFGPPAIFPKALLDGLPETGDQGARSLLGDAHGPVAVDWMVRDIDTIADLQAVAHHLRLARR